MEAILRRSKFFQIFSFKTPVSLQWVLRTAKQHRSSEMLKRKGEIVCNYDRGWDVQPVDEDTQLAYEILVHTENF